MIAEIQPGTVVVPWQLAAVVVGGLIAVILVLAMQLRDSADRRTQERNEAIRFTRQTQADSLKWAARIWVHLWKRHMDATERLNPVADPPNQHEGDQPSPPHHDDS